MTAPVDRVKLEGESREVNQIADTNTATTAITYESKGERHTDESIESPKMFDQYQKDRHPPEPAWLEMFLLETPRLGKHRPTNSPLPK